MEATTKRRSIAAAKKTHREVRFGAYILGSTLGEGEFGKVKLGWRKDGKQPSQAAIKLIRRSSIPKGSDRELKIHREINALKRLAHPNIVRLEEVLQNDKYIGIVLEYASGGELFDYILENRYLKDHMASKLFAQLVSGVDYMHSKGIVHRDLKLENLLLDKHKNIIITDFGFVNSFAVRGSELMKTSCGSPCYAAPELVVTNEPYEARKVDVWSCGVILYAMLAGYLPFDDDPQNPDGDNIARLYYYITHSPLTFPEYLQPAPRDLLRKMLVADPKRRMNLKAIRSHQWLASHAPYLSVTPAEWDRNYRSTRQRTPSTQDKSRRLSLMEGTNGSLMLNRPSIRSYSSQNISTMLYSNPAIPQTSSSHAMGIATPNSSTSINDLASSKSPGAPGALSAHEEEGNHTHSRARSLSSASIALQAVVNADVASNTKRLLSEATRSPPLLETGGNHNCSTIVESPLKHDSSAEGLLPPSQVLQTPPTRLPSHHNRPRPTSYHPGGSSSYQFQSSESSLPIFNYVNNSSISIPINKHPGTSRSRTGFSTLSNHSSPTKESLLMPTEPFVDKSQASGVLAPLENVSKTKHADMVSTSDDPALMAENGSPIRKSVVAKDAAEKKEKRKSIALDSLSQAMDTLNMNDGTTKLAVASSEIKQPEMRQYKLQQRKNQDKENKTKPERKRFSLLSFYTSGSTSSPVDSVEIESPLEVRRPLVPSNEVNVLKNNSTRLATSKDIHKDNSASTAKKVMDFFKRRSVRI
ncbi:BA75_00792T0 [Komagataella pastoris]|uniref:non-specific serine/threonine protein kinase n=1 Tax=Komagataella pastoris TaxID=4922 RepID=A0A1B2J724_PICPA|nr:BA75_00792T0 [Komagataella pastoris]